MEGYCMTKPKPALSERAQLLATAVSRWDTEGGAGDGGRDYQAARDLPTVPLSVPPDSADDLQRIDTLAP